MKFKREMIIISLIICMLFAVSAVSAAESDVQAISAQNSTDDVVSTVNDDNLEMNNNGEILAETDDGSFDALNSKISGATAGSTVDLWNNYNYNSGATAIEITQNNLVIDGHGKTTINANNYTNIFKVSGSGVTIKNIKFINGLVNSGDSGGAITWNGGNGNILNCSFNSNRATGSYDGGAIYTENIVLNIENCTFIDNVATGSESGGAISIFNGKLTIKNSKFIHNTGNVGAITNLYNAGVFNQCIFINNTGNTAGSIYWYTYNSGNLLNSIFLNNVGSKEIEIDRYYTNGQYYGNVYANGNWWGNTVENNIRPNVANSVVLNSWYLLNITTNGANNIATLTLNNLYDGTDIKPSDTYALPSVTFDVEGTNATLNKDKVTLDGNGKASFDFTVNEDIGKLTANSNGVSISKDVVNMADEGTMAALNTKITEAISNGESQVKLYNDYVYSDTELVKNTINNGISNNGIGIATDFTIDGQGYTIDGNNRGGRIFYILAQSKFVTLKNINFVECTDDYAGVLYAAKCDLRIINCTFTNNTVTANPGGAAYVSNPVTVEIINSTFIKNKAPSGGAIFIFGTQTTNVNVSESMFINNNAINNVGSAIYCNKYGSYTINNCILLNNSGYAVFNNNTLSTLNVDYNWWGHTIENSDVWELVSSYDENAYDNWIYLDVAIDDINSLATVKLNNLYTYGVGPSTYDYDLPKITLNVKTNNADINTNTITLDEEGEAIISYEMTANEGTLTVSFENGELTKNIKSFVPDSFTSLKKQINETDGTTFTLYQNYNYNAGFDESITTNGIEITKSITIDGNGKTIDAKGFSNIFSFNDDTNTKTLILKNIIFANAHGTNGAAVYFKGKQIQIINCTFINNTATGQGDAIYVADATGSENKITGSTFINNTGTNSIAYVNLEDSNAKLNLNNSIFIGNDATFDVKGTSNVIADYNWWGNVVEDYKTVSPKVDGATLNNWLVLNLTADTDTNIATLSLNNLYDGNVLRVYESYALPSITLNIRGTNATVKKASVTNVTLDNSGETNVTFNLLKLDAILTACYEDIETNAEIHYVVVDDGTFKALNDIIRFSSENDVINLTKDYVYSDTDIITSGIQITKTITINGNNHIIDAKGNCGIFLINSPNVVFKNITFKNGIFQNGGAIYCSQNANYLTVDNCTFINNTATNTDGGAIWSGSYYFGSVTNSIFINNTAVEDGAALFTYSFYTDAIIDNCWFINNSAQYTVIYAYYMFNCHDSIFLNNAANYIINGKYSTWGTVGNNWYGNTFDDYENGPAIGHDSYKWLYLNIKFYEDYAVVSLNNLYSSSSGVSSVYSNYNLPEITLNINSTTLNLETDKITLDANGQAIVPYTKISEDAKLTLSNDYVSLTKDVIVGDFYILQGLINNNDEINLTRDYIYNSEDFITEGILINKNITIDGKGHIIDAKEMTRIFNVQATGVTFKNIVFVNGKSNLDWLSNKPNDGGAIYYNLDNNELIEFNVINCTFINNTAIQDITSKSFSGAAIYIKANDGEYNIEDSTFINNNAKGKGGAIYINTTDAEFNLYNSSFTGNKGYNDGALYIETDGTDITIDKCIFKENAAISTYYSNNGNAIIWNTTNDNGNSVVKNSIFLDNGNQKNNGQYTFLLISGTVNIDDNWWGTTDQNHPEKFNTNFVSSGVTPNNWLFVKAIVSSDELNYNETATIKYILQSHDGYSETEFDNSKLPDVDFDVTCDIGELNKGTVSLNEEFTYRATDVGIARIDIYCNNIVYETYIHGPYMILKVDDYFIIYANQYSINKNNFIKTANGYYSHVTMTCNDSSLLRIEGSYINAYTKEGTAKLTFSYDGYYSGYSDVECLDLIVKVVKVPLNITVNNLESNEIILNVTDILDLDIAFEIDEIHKGYAPAWDVIGTEYNSSVISFDYDNGQRPDNGSYYPTGHIIAKGGGTTNLIIYCTSDKFKWENYTLKITVNRIPTEITLGDGNSFEVDDTANINANSFINGTQATIPLVYESSDEDVIKFTSNSGDFKAVGNGTAVLTVKFNGNSTHENSSKSITVTVSKKDTSISLTSASEVTLDVFGESQITASLSPSEAGNLKYKSSNTNVATVDETGKITAVGGGKANITIYFAGDYKYAAAQVNVTVTVNKLPTIITVDSTNTVYVDASKSLGASANHGRALNYTSLNPEIVTVDDNGVITGVIGGTGVINVSFVEDGQYLANSTTVTVTVNKLTPSITVNPIEIDVFESRLINPAIVSDGVVSYVSCDSAIVTVNTTNGNITGVKGGKANITIKVAESDRYIAAQDVNVTVTVNKLPTIITVDSTNTVDVDASKSLGATADNGRSLKYESLNPEIVTVDDTGVITGVIGGTGVINVSFVEDGQYLANSTTVTVTVNKLTPSIIVNPIEIDVFESKLVNPAIVSDGVVSYVSCDSAIVAVNVTNGNITGVKGGKANITIKVAESNRYLAKDVNVTVTVNKLPTAITVSPTMRLKIGDSQSIVASVVSGADIHYHTDADLISVDDTGLVTAIKGGIAEVTVSVDATDEYNANSTVVTVTVTRLPDDDTPITLSVFSQADVSTLYDFGGDPSNLKFISSNSTVFTVSDAGILDANAGGEANLTIKDEILGENVTIKVIVNKLETPMDTVPEISIDVYQNVTLDVTIPSKANKTQLHYESSSPDVASVDENGVVTGVIGGTATITVRYIEDGQFKENSTKVKVTVNKLQSLITVNESEFSIFVFEKAVINATTNNEEGLYYASNSPCISLEDNVVTGISNGTVEIRVIAFENEKYLGNTTIVRVTVKRLPTNIDVNPTIDVDVDESKSLAAIADNGRKLTFTSLNPDVVTVDDNGVITGITGGTGVINISFAGDNQYVENSSTVTVTVNKLTPTIEVNPIEINVFESQLINPAIVSDGSVSYLSSSSEIVSVNSTSGNITAIKGGNVNITIKVAESQRYLAGEANVTVSVNKIPTAISVDSPISIDYGKTKSIGATAEGRTLEYVSGNSEIVAVDGNGKITALKRGVANVTVKFSEDDYYLGDEVNVTVTVRGLPISVAITEIDENVYVGGKSTIKLTIDKTDATGFVIVYVNETKYPINISETKSVAVVLDNIGEYDVQAVYQGDDKYETAQSNPEKITASAKHAENAIYVNVTQNIITGDKVEINATSESGTIEIYVDGVNQTVTDGRTIIDSLSVGNHTIKVVSPESEKYLANSTEFTVSVGKRQSDINISVEGDLIADSIIKINIEYTGSNILVYMDGKILEDYEASFKATSGNHLIFATVNEDDEYLASSKNYNFTVSKKPSEIYVTGTSVTIGQASVIEVSDLPNDATGIVIINLNGTNYSLNLTEGKTTAIVLDNPGLYDVSAKYLGDDKYLPSESAVNTIFAEDKKVTLIEIEIPGEIYAGDSITINVTSNNDRFDVLFDGVKMEIIDGKLTIDDIASGNHKIEVVANETSELKANSTSESFNAAKKESKVNIALPEKIELGDDIEINVTSYDGADIEVYIDGEKQSVKDGKVTIRATLGKHTVIASVAESDRYLSSSDNKVFTVEKFDSQITVSGLNITEGEKTTITISTQINEGIVSVKVNGSEIFINLEKTNSCELQLDVPGDYEVTASYLGSDNYKPSQANTTINVAKKPTPEIEVSASGDANAATIEITLPENTTGSVTVTVDGDKKYTKELTEGKASFEVANLTSGAHNVTVSYSGDGKYSQVDKNSTIDVAKVKTDMDVKADVNNSKVNVDVTLPDDAKGTVDVYVDGNKVTSVNVVKGKTNSTIDDLDVGTHNITVSYSGDDKYGEISKNTTAEISKEEKSDASMTTEINTSGNSAVVDVTLPNDAKGTVDIYVDGNKVDTLNVVNGKANATVGNLDEGSHNITVTYSGDDKYNNKTESKKADVSSKVTDFNVTAVSESDTQKSNTIVVEAPSDATGTVIVKVGNKTYSAPVKEGKAVIDVGDLSIGNYTAEITYSGDDKYENKTTTSQINVKSKVSDYDLTATVQTAIEGSTKIVVEAPSDATGTVSVKVGNNTYSAPIKDGKAVIDAGNLPNGNYVAQITYSGDSNYEGKNISKDIAVAKKVKSILAYNLKRGEGSPYDYIAKFFDKNGKVLANKYVNFIVGGKKYTVKTNKNGVARLTTSKLAHGTYKITSVNPVTGEKVTMTTKIIKRLLLNKDVVKYYSTAKAYKVLVIGDNGKPVGAGVTVVFKVNGVTYNVKTDKDGYATRTIGLIPGKYVITAQYAGCKVANKVIVTQVLKSSNVVVKKSASSFILKATVKTSNGKAFVGRTVSFTFKGVTYKVFTDKNGVAAVKIPKKVINTLHSGNNYVFTVRYVDTAVKKLVIVK